MENKKTYKVKVSFILLIIVFCIIFFPLVFKFDIIYLFISIIIYSFILHIFFSVKYTLVGEVLIIKNSFLLNEKINIKEITSIKETNSILSSPAPSFDRLEIKYQKFKRIIISPKNRKIFIRDLTTINPQIII